MYNKRALFLLLLSFQLLCASAFAQKKNDADSLIATLPSLKDTALVNRLNLIAVICTKTGEGEKALNYSERALEEAQQIGYKKGIGTAYRNLGVYYKNSNDLKTALDYYHKAIAVSEQDNDPRSAAASYNNIANIHVGTGDYKKAVEAYFRSLKLKEKAGDRKGIATTLNGVAGVYYMQGNVDLAEDYFRRSLKIREEIGDESGIAAVLNNLGGICQTRGDHEDAVTYFHKALAIQERLGEKRAIPNTLNHLGESYAEQKKYMEALKVYMDALPLYEQTRDLVGKGMVSNNLGNVYLRMKEYDRAEEWIMKALSYSEQTQTKDLRRATYVSLTDLHRQKGDFKKAFAFQEKLMLLKDTILNESTNKAIAEANTKYETEHKELQISSLEKDKAISEYEINKQKNFKYTFMVFSLLIVVLAFVLLRGYNVKKKANVLLAVQKEEIEFQKAIVDEKNKDITDSIRYAKRIQDAILPSAATVARLLPESFILFRPKDIVSGDFYWMEQKDNNVFFAAVDCTGHGVPGALMSIVGHNLLNQALSEPGITDPASLLDSLNKGVSRTLQQKEEESTVKDGMDIALCSLNKEASVLEFAGAFNSLYLIRDQQLTEIKGNKFPVGIFLEEKMQRFSNHRIELKKGDVIYIFTDGYADQFGGARGKKFKYKQLQEKLKTISPLPMAEQEKILNDTIEEWKGNLEQVDDILVIGVRIPGA